MESNQLANIEDLSELRPEDMRTAFKKASASNTDLTTHPLFNDAINILIEKFKSHSQSYSKKTIDRLFSAWDMFVNWCVANNLRPIPAKHSTVESFFTSQHAFYRRNSIKTFQWAISKIHLVCGCPDPCHDEYVKLTIRGICREKVDNREPVKQASAFNEKHLDAIIDIWGNSKTLISLRNILVLAIAYESMLRCSELINIRLDDLEETDDGLVLTIPYTKSNHSGDPYKVIFSDQVKNMIAEYLSLCGLYIGQKGPFLFSKVSKHGKLVQPKQLVSDFESNSDAIMVWSPVTPKTIERVFERAWCDLNLTCPKFTTHSARVGACQDLLKKDFTMLQVQQSGRWSSPTMVWRYGKGILAKESAMARSRRDKELKSTKPSTFSYSASFSGHYSY